MNWGLKMTKRELSEDQLDALFDAALRDVPEPQADFLARLAGDAERTLSTPSAARARPAPPKDTLRTALGGWLGLGGLVTATLAGVWIGATAPDMLPDPATLLTSLTTDAAVQTDLWFGVDEETWLILDEG